MKFTSMTASNKASVKTCAAEATIKVVTKIFTALKPFRTHQPKATPHIPKLSASLVARSGLINIDSKINVTTRAVNPLPAP